LRGSWTPWRWTRTSRARCPGSRSREDNTRCLGPHREAVSCPRSRCRGFRRSSSPPSVSDFLRLRTVRTTMYRGLRFWLHAGRDVGHTRRASTGERRRVVGNSRRLGGAVPPHHVGPAQRESTGGCRRPSAASTEATYDREQGQRCRGRLAVFCASNLQNNGGGCGGVEAGGLAELARLSAPRASRSQPSRDGGDDAEAENECPRKERGDGKATGRGPRQGEGGTKDTTMMFGVVAAMASSASYYLATCHFARPQSLFRIPQTRSPWTNRRFLTSREGDPSSRASVKLSAP